MFFSYLFTFFLQSKIKCTFSKKKLFFQEKAFDVWDNFKLLHIAAKSIKSAGDTDEKTERRKKQREKYQKRQLILPAGMDIGRFIEDSLQKFVHIFFQLFTY